MTGKEALIEMYSNTYFKMRFGSKAKFIQYQRAIEKDLNQLFKYKRAFEILKHIVKIRELDKNEKDLFEQEYELYADHLVKYLTKEQYELLEELTTN